ncbi:hypothetical protein INR49_031752 [Caranx melampygus]|nr:hypothetical protein INR49_031752 [Caranx melampygus]
MAANESQQSGVESIVNRWVVDYYLFLALEAYKNGQAAVFCGTRHILNSVLDRPYESTDTLPTKIGILHFLSRIYDGERLDYLFESDHSITPLESALTLLDGLANKCSVSQEDVANARSSIKEMMVRVLIKNDEFDKAKELLNKYFPKPMVGKKAIYMGLISKKSKQHELIERIDFRQFKDEMLTFCQKFCSFNVPFLHKAATQLIDKRLIEQSDVAAGSCEQGESGVTNPQMVNISFVPCKHTVMPRSRLEEVYKALTAGSKGRTFSQLEEEVEREQARKEHLCLHLSPTPKSSPEHNGLFQKSPEHNGLFQRESGSPMEASPADQPPQTDTAPETHADSLSKTHSAPKKRRLYTVAQLVVEPDSQTSLQSSTLSQEQETELGAEELPQSPAVSNEDSQSLYLTDSEVAVPSRTLHRRTSKRCSRASPSLSSDSGGSVSRSVDIRKTNEGKSQNQLNRSLTRKLNNSKQLSSDSDKDSQDSPGTLRTPAGKTRKQMASDRLSKQDRTIPALQPRAIRER